MSTSKENTTAVLLDALRAQGMLADTKLAEAGLVLTQGGEPTFLPEDTSAPEWNLAALGEEKLKLAWLLCRELGRTLLPGAFILRSNGKQYPGEPIPRWKLTLLQNRKGPPLWSDPTLLLNGEEAKERPVSPRRFLSTLASKLGISGGVRPVYEDVEAAMRHAVLSGGEAPLPRYSRTRKAFIQPRWSREHRKTWQRYHRAAGWVLPLDRMEEQWVTADWRMPDGSDMLLLPGTSSIGLRLPLHRLPPGVLACSLTAEIREGALTLFVPPLPDTAAFGALLAVIEQTAKELQSAPIAIEGYPPPEEGSLDALSVIPDPGVIEVNLPPAADWSSLEKTVTALFESAERTGLRGSRVLPSGEVVATGGGAHLVLGGTSLEKNPFLQRPSLLPSFLRFIQNHPVLSYLYSGRFTGPSSQAPRIDESFFEVPYELEIALRAIESMTAPAEPAMIDAILRNLLLDLHGNTHKAEVSVDKFFNPFMPNGRLGLVEFRAIEMTPDIGTFLTVHALWRALAAVFAKVPYTNPLVEWGSELHNRFFLPSFLEEDLDQVLRFLSEHGFTFDRTWFETHLQFRFPVLARESVGAGQCILRRAAEPWPLLGEQPSPMGGVVRCVDSSTERLEIHLRGLPESTEALVNGHPLPLLPHPDEGLVAGVRFRTISLPTCLHPQVLPEMPLEIALLDGESVLGLWHYHAHPEPAESGQGAPRKHVTPLRGIKPKKARGSSRPRRGTMDLRSVSPVGEA